MRVQYLLMNKHIPLVPVTPTYSQLCTVSSSVYSEYLLSTNRCGNSLSYGVWSQAYFDVVSIALRLAPTWDDLFSGLNSVTLITLSCDPKLSPAGQQTAKHDGLYPLLTLCWALSAVRRSLSYWFLRLSLSLLLSSDSISESHTLAFKRS